MWGGVHTDVHRFLHLCKLRGQRRMWGSLYSHSIPCFFGTESLGEPRVNLMARKPQWSSCLCPPQNTQILAWVWNPNSDPSFLYSKHCYPLSRLPSPFSSFFKWVLLRIPTQQCLQNLTPQNCFIWPSNLHEAWKCCFSQTRLLT